MGIICGSSASNISDCSVKSTAELFETTGSAVKNIYMGGLCGQQTRSIEKCTVNAGRLSANDISATSNAYIGGLVGNVSGNVNLCTVKFTNDTQKTINGESYPLSISVTSAAPKIGGIAGGFAETAKIKDCMYDGKSISSDSSSPISASYVGGLIGIAKAKTPKTVSVQGGQSLSRSSLPMRDGYRATWYTDSDLKNKFDFSQPVTSDVTLYAKWTESETDTPIWDGTSSEPAYNADTKTYTVTNGQELAWVSDVTNGIITSGNNFPTDISFKGYTIELANDIYLNDTTGWENWETNPPKNEWKPIGKDENNSFSGIFDGKKYVIYGAYHASNEAKYVGLFGYLNSSSIIKNIDLFEGYYNYDVKAQNYIGGIVGYCLGKISECNNKVNIKTNNSAMVSHVGGIVARIESGEIDSCINYGNIINTGYYLNGVRKNNGGELGGIVSSASKTQISNCINYGTITGSIGYTAGIVARFYGESETMTYGISNCSNFGQVANSNTTSGVTNTNYGLCVAGIAADCTYQIYIDSCFNGGNIIGGSADAYVAGIVSDTTANSKINNCVNTGTIKNGNTTGGIIAYASDNMIIDNCYNMGDVNSDNGSAGGIAGRCYFSQTEACHSVGSISGGYAGGIAGYCMSSQIENCYSVGSISGGYAGGIAGRAHGYTDNCATIRYCYSTKSTLIGLLVENVTRYSVSYKSPSEMKNLSNLPGFSTSEWAVDSNINNGYPYLKSLEDTYKTYKITVVEDPENSAAVNRSFANIDGMLFSNATGTAYAGGIIGYGSGTKSDAKNLLGVANKISSKTSSNSFYAYSGNIIGDNYNNAFNFDTIFSNSGLSLSAVNTSNSSNAKTDSIGSQLMDSQLRRATTLNRIFGPDTYQSLEYLNEHPEAVWVVKDGELPQLYYNVLRDITLDKVENGTISVDKTQAVDGERVSVTAIPAENYQLNKIYVNGEVVGDTFVVDGDSKVYATFSEKTPEYKARVESANNAFASLVDVDSTSEVSLMSVEDTISAQDGSEIRVDTETDTDYAIEAVYVNGEELPSDSFIITKDSVVTIDVANISTNINAVTNDAENIGNYFATLSGSVEGDNETTEKYIRYWAADNPNEVYTTDIEVGSGDYSVEVTNLIPETEYKYQMTETGEVKSFIAKSLIEYGDDGDITIPTLSPATPNPTSEPTLQPTNVPTLKPTLAPTATPIKSPIPTVAPTDNLFEIRNVQAAGGKVTADITNVSAAPQSGIVIFVAYSSNGMLAGVENRDIRLLGSNNSLPCEFTMPSGASKYKIFIWNSYKEMIPLAESIEI